MTYKRFGDARQEKTAQTPAFDPVLPDRHSVVTSGNGRLVQVKIKGMIDYARGFAILLAFYVLGLLLHRIGIPIPGGVLGLLLFYLGLASGLVRLVWVEKTATLLLRHMVLLFVPLAVGLMEMGQVIARQAVPIVASLLVSWVAVLLTTGLLGRWLLPADREPMAVAEVTEVSQ
jgi:holin-like protein